MIATTALCVSAFAQWNSSGNYAILSDNTDSVGIGTTNPGGKCEVAVPLQGSISWDLIIRNSDEPQATLGKGHGIKFAYGYGSTNQNKYAGIASLYGDNWYAGITALVFYTADLNNYPPVGERMRITGAGKVGIGDTAPSEKLDVNGNIKGDTVKCAAVKINGWMLNAPDYVFEKGYELPSLREVEKHIALKKHLPDVPSASEIKKDGLDLAEMNMTLLRKVEELTIYAIEQNKRLENQQKQINGLKGLIKIKDAGALKSQ
ncbi:MAG: hypothetical protein JW768_07730 [Chitinispirillaceae bacterium]|nr:hypothetical protein [Chitinispirillaceae bacterium]